MNISDSQIIKLYIHYVGNKLNNEDCLISKRKIEIGEALTHKRLIEFYLTPFLKSYELYNFTHNSSLKFNELYSFAGSIFEDPSSISKISGDIAKQLYENSIHPKVVGGEMHVLYIKDIMHDNKLFDAIGILKTETKINFLKLNSENNNYNIEFDEGINPADGFDKGCLILNNNKKEGYQVYIIDNQSRSQEAQYWKDNFLGVKTATNEYNNTQNYMKICKDFVVNKITTDFEVTKTDQINLLNKSINYFKENENFVEKDFAKSVFEDPNVIKSFKQYKNEYLERTEIELEDDFEISSPAVKKQIRNFKSVLKLDRNFHIYIHGNKDLIEQGVEKDGRKYYKIYYEKEV